MRVRREALILLALVWRMFGYFALVFAALYVLRHVPWIGGIFRVPIIGFVLAAAIVSFAIAWLTTRAVDARRAKSLEQELGAVDTPHNRGKLGSLVLAQGRARRAIVHLERAHQGEPTSGEWSYRLGCALLEAGRAADAVPVLERSVAVDESRAYGMVLVRLAHAQQRAGLHERALATLLRFERNHSANPESAWRRGVALRALGRRDEARAAFAEVAKIAAQSARFQRKSSQGWVLRAWLARLT